MRSLIVSILFLTVSPVLGDEATDLDNYRLWNACEPMSVWITRIDSYEAKAIGLTDENIRVIVRNNLHAAGLHQSHAEQHIVVSVGAAGGDYTFSVKYLKPNLTGGKGSYIVAWKRSSSGVHGGRSERIFSVMSRYLDEFITEYKRVNADSCGR